MSILQDIVNAMSWFVLLFMQCNTAQSKPSVASRLWNCENPAKYIYQLRKWRASEPVCLQKKRTACIFQQPMQPFKKLCTCLWLHVRTITRRYLCNFLWLISSSYLNHSLQFSLFCKTEWGGGGVDSTPFFFVILEGPLLWNPSSNTETFACPCDKKKCLLVIYKMLIMALMQLVFTADRIELGRGVPCLRSTAEWLCVLKNLRLQ